jgi:2,3-bisphosphoglycerate-dependent phosphoglycerate mutase
VTTQTRPRTPRSIAPASVNRGLATTTMLIARHGETAWNREGRFQGHADLPLSDEGRAQARALADELADVPLAAVYSSDLRRALETAEEVARRKGVEVQPVRELREVDVGEWSGLTWLEIQSRFPEGVRRHNDRGHGWETGESYGEMAERVVGALRAIAARHGGERVLVVVHGGTMRAIAAHIDGVDVARHRRDGRATPAANCEIRVVAVDDGLLRHADAIS